MLSKPRGIIFSAKRSVAVVGPLCVVLLICSVSLKAETKVSNVVCRDALASERRDELAGKLRRISGWPDLEFDSSGILRQGSKEPVGGSSSARELLAKVILGTTAVVLEDASKSSEVAFCRVIPGKWKHGVQDNRPAFVVQIDFADFEQVIGDEPALEAFNVGWGLLHELDHIANDSLDATSLGATGECEEHINQMRRECNLPQRADYFYTVLPLSGESIFATRLVRLAFEREDPFARKKKRYWIVWDANVVGGLDAQKQIAALR
jgi:hypothetical protein